MAIIKHNTMPFKPYARLMNIIGDQLITDKKVAVVEIIKNSYDADSEWVNVRFGNMSNLGFHDLPKEEQAYIEIEDGGSGMSLDIIENVWLRPATPHKINKKRNKITKTSKGRIIQGEKGIGRFAIHKLGEKIELFSKAEGCHEVKLEMNFGEFNPEDQNLFNQSQEYKLLEDVSNNLYVNHPPERVFSKSGTIIRISNLRENWTKKDLNELYKNIQRLIPPIDKNAKSLGVDFINDFEIKLYKDDKLYVCEEVMTFNDVIERAQYTMIGKITDDGIIEYSYRSTSPLRSFDNTVNLLDSDDLMINNYSLVGTKWFADDQEVKRKPACGAFSFTFYAFNLAKPDKTILNEDLKKFIKENFVFVLRDGVRVYPYGEKGVDWLNLDKLRSTYRAGQFISYNDLTGFIYISQEKNPDLSDSSNRQGIVNKEGKYDDFTNLVTAATEIFNTEIKIDKLKEEVRNKAFQAKSKSVLKTSFEQLQNSLSRIDDVETLNLASKFLDVYQKHLEVIEQRMETVEDLAGLGMAVEKSSHDSLRLLSLMRHNIKDFRKRVNKESYDQNELFSLLDELDENLQIVYDDMQMIQPLFKIQRKAITNVSVTECIGKVIKYFRSDFDNKIISHIDNFSGDILIKTNVGLILQVLINLIDNSVYWLNSTNISTKKLSFKLDPFDQTLIVADNGKGIREDVASLVFQEFFSMKSDGRGLGLYIVRELLSRIGAEIYVLMNDDDKILPGANFIIKFNTNDK